MNTPVKLWRNQKQLSKFLGKTGLIVSFTVVRVAPEGFESQTPYPVVMINFNQQKLIGQLVDYEKEQLCIGQKVIAVLRRIKESDPEQIIPYGMKFKPI